jgi:acetylornithine/N-succinyldiaminopimelate aminotransferase
MKIDTGKFIAKLMNHKLLTVKAEENCLRLFPPLTVTNQELDEGLEIIQKTCKEY